MIINSLKNLRVRYDESDKTSYSEKVSMRNSKAFEFLEGLVYKKNILKGYSSC